MNSHSPKHLLQHILKTHKRDCTWFFLIESKTFTLSKKPSFNKDDISLQNGRSFYAFALICLDARDEQLTCSFYHCMFPNDKHHSPKPIKSYEGDVLTLWDEFKKLVEDLGKGTIGASTVENFYKQKTNSKPNTLKLIAPLIKKLFDSVATSYFEDMPFVHWSLTGFLMAVKPLWATAALFFVSLFFLTFSEPGVCAALGGGGVVPPRGGVVPPAVPAVIQPWGGGGIAPSWGFGCSSLGFWNLLGLMRNLLRRRLPQSRRVRLLRWTFFDAAYMQQTGEIIKELDVSLAEKPRVAGSNNTDGVQYERERKFTTYNIASLFKFYETTFGTISFEWIEAHERAAKIAKSATTSGIVKVDSKGIRLADNQEIFHLEVAGPPSNYTTRHTIGDTKKTLRTDILNLVSLLPNHLDCKIELAIRLKVFSSLVIDDRLTLYSMNMLEDGHFFATELATATIPFPFDGRTKYKTILQLMGIFHDELLMQATILEEINCEVLRPEAKTVRDVLRLPIEIDCDKIVPYIFKLMETKSLQEYLDNEKITYEIYQERKIINIKRRKQDNDAMGDEIDSLHIVLNAKLCWIEMSLLMKTVEVINVPNVVIARKKLKEVNKINILIEKMITLPVIFTRKV
ncbi:hypothetical protein G9A89_018497 [Geosiphon pyriformis]|nr:hypothetical protein G9A89_018497 [Geosiphon pyriformis]